MKKSKPTTKPSKVSKADADKALPVHPALKKSLGYCLSKAAMRNRQLMDAALMPYDLVTHQFAILFLLKHSGPLSQVDIGQELYIDKASMVRFLDGLEQLGFIKRAPGQIDRRIKTVTITANGLKMSETLAEIRNQVQHEFLSPLTEAEKKAYGEIIPKLVRG